MKVAPFRALTHLILSPKSFISDVEMKVAPFRALTQFHRLIEHISSFRR